ncbi:MAG: transglutaminaseTgpA domain-containing protein [Burkholderiaceae bacterium]
MLKWPTLARAGGTGVTAPLPMPRECRDTLFLLAVLAWVVLPHAARLPLWCAVMTGAVLVWRAVLAWQARPLPGVLVRVALLALAVGATWFSHRTVLGRDAGVTLIVVLLALKTLELRARRDAFVVFFLGFFTLLTHFFFSQSLLTALAILLALLGLMTALVNAHMPAGTPTLWQSARIALRLAAVGTPVMIALFLLFPRLAPLWGLPSDSQLGRTGLSSSMRVGQIAQLVLDDSVAMRIRFDGAPPRRQDLYFRGPVLSDFDGREWRPRALLRPNEPPANLQIAGEPVRYEVTLEPSHRPWVFTLEATPQPPQMAGQRIKPTPDLLWLSESPLTDLVRYRAESHTTFRYGPATRRGVSVDDRDLPTGFNPRTLQWAVDLRRDPRFAQGNDAGLVQFVLNHLRTQGYTYTLEPGVYGDNAADEFWFDRKAGFCEHFASAFAVLMRAADVPARIVTGYQGGDINPVDGFWTVRQSDAHAWVEVWLDGNGWVRIDPTAAVAPGRTGSIDRLRPTPGPVAAALDAIAPRFAVVNLRLMWEALNNRWNQWVLNYTQSRQLDLLRSLGFQSPSWQHLGYLLAGTVTLASLLGAAVSLWQRRRVDPWLALLAEARTALARRGVAVSAQATPRELAQAARQRWGSAAQALCDWLMRLETLRYAGSASPSSAGIATLRREWKQLQREIPGVPSRRPMAQGQT